MDELFKKTIRICNVDMYGPHILNSEKVKSIEKRNGNYALGYLNKQGDMFITKYVGKGNLDDRLGKHTNDDLYNCINDNYDQPYFAFIYLEDERDSYTLECIMYHAFNNLLNINHPELPKGIRCPYLYCSHIGGETK